MRSSWVIALPNVSKIIGGQAYDDVHTAAQQPKMNLSSSAHVSHA